MLKTSDAVTWKTGAQWTGAFAAIALVFSTLTAQGQVSGNSQSENAIAAPETSAQNADAPDQQTSIQSSLGAYGDPGGVRSFLRQKGITYNLTYIGETLGNPTGGLLRGSIYEGRLEADLDVDLDKLAGWIGASAHASYFQLHGQGLSRNFIGNSLVASGIEARPNNRLYELWFEQKLFDGFLSVRAGQQGADSEFLVSSTASLFLNNSFGWPALNANNLPSTGPAFPFSTPAVRVKLQPSEDVTLLAAVFNGDPAGPETPFKPSDPERRDRSNTLFRTRDPALIMAEADFAYKLPTQTSNLPGTVKVGFWQHLDRFDDQRFDTSGNLLADPSSSGIARRLRGNTGLYGIIDQTVYRVPDTVDQGVSVFARVVSSPGDRNSVDLYVDGGVSFKGLVPSRPDDTFGFAAAYVSASRSALGFDLDSIALAGAVNRPRSYEAVVEATYQYLVLPAWTVQPDIQYIFRPGGITGMQRQSGGVVPNTLVLGLRTAIRY